MGATQLCFGCISYLFITHYDHILVFVNKRESSSAVVGVLNERFRQALSVCKELSSSGTVAAVDSRTSTITADKLIYNYAIEMVSN